MRWDSEVGSMSLFSVASLTFFFFPSTQLALSSSGAYSEMKREMGGSEEPEDPAVYWKALHFFPPVVGDTARAARVPSV